MTGRPGMILRQPRREQVGSDDYIDELRNDHLGLVGSSPGMVALRDLIRRVATSDRPVLVSGPRGSGKSLVAEAISRLGSPAGNGRIVVVNCAEIGEDGLDQILFGSGALPGVLAAPDLGSVVLDQIDALPADLQTRVVNALQTGMVRTRDGQSEQRLSVRIVAITSRALARLVRENAFRADLLYELGVLSVPVPALDQHRSDVPALVNHFLRLDGSELRFSAEAIDLLAGRPWPGNVRELRGVVSRAVALAREPLIGKDSIKALLAPEAPDAGMDDSLQSLAGRLLDLPIRNKLAAVEAALLGSAMRLSGGNKSAAARLLGLHRKAVERKLEKHRLSYAAIALPEATSDQVREDESDVEEAMPEAAAENGRRRAPAAHWPS